MQRTSTKPISLGPTVVFTLPYTLLPSFHTTNFRGAFSTKMFYAFLAPPHALPIWRPWNFFLCQIQQIPFLFYFPLSPTEFLCTDGHCLFSSASVFSVQSFPSIHAPVLFSPLHCFGRLFTSTNLSSSRVLQFFHWSCPSFFFFPSNFSRWFRNGQRFYVLQAKRI